MLRITHATKVSAALALLLNLVACATTEHLAVSSADRANAVVRISYEYPEFQEPELSDPKLNDEKAMKLALARCEGWGFDRAEPIAGKLRQCSNMNGSNCDLWTVTREYQCRDRGGFASNFAK